ncbi:MAG: hypothetical protein JHD16_09295 [Solirubrobacteraceae bacterium]|nr:hypothetical protein [Solirubrobacteraceae bacterium]
MSANETRDLIEQAVERMLAELPALKKLPLVFQLELRGRGDKQLYRVELTGTEAPPIIDKGMGEGAKIMLGVTRPHFNTLADKGTVALWREAFIAGHAHVAGPPQMLKLILNVVERHDKRAAARRHG